jgi:hypothetical protein
LVLQVIIRHGPHLLDGRTPGALVLETEMLINQAAVKAFNDNVGSRSFHAGGEMEVIFKLEERSISAGTRFGCGPLALGTSQA